MSSSPGSLQGLRILVVEDEVSTANAICERLKSAGCVICGIVGDGSTAIETARYTQRT